MSHTIMIEVGETDNGMIDICVTGFMHLSKEAKQKVIEGLKARWSTKIMLKEEGKNTK